VKYDHPTPYFHNVSVHVCLNCSIYLNQDRLGDQAENCR
jgi:hypothetical protein